MIKVLKPNLKIRALLSQKKRELEERIKQLTGEDPFKNSDRLTDNAASDTEAKEEVGHEQIEALKNEIMKDIALIKKALSQIGIGKYGFCKNCTRAIDKARLEVFPQAISCMECEQQKETA